MIMPSKSRKVRVEGFLRKVPGSRKKIRIAPQLRKRPRRR